MSKIIALFGKSASGKDTIQNYMCKNYKDTHKIISCTTRPPRVNEVDRQDYFFISQKSFYEKILDDKMLEATSFNDWLYGTSIDQLRYGKINIGVFNIQGVYSLLNKQNSILKNYEIIPIMICCSDRTRLLRSLTRDDNTCLEICRRFLADEKDFEEIPFEYKIVNNNDNANIKEVCGRIAGIANLYNY